MGQRYVEAHMGDETIDKYRLSIKTTLGIGQAMENRICQESIMCSSICSPLWSKDSK